jgi:predicted N-acyltransferase
MKGELKIDYIDMRTQDNKWDQIVSSSYPRTFFHTSSWLKLIEKSYGLKSHHMILLEEDDPVFAMPMFSSKTALHSPYIADYGGLCVRDKHLKNPSLLMKAFGYLNSEIEKIGKSERVQMAYIRGFYNNRIVDDLLRQAGFKKTTDQLTYVLSDFYHESDILKIFHKKTRNAVRKALKEGLEVEHVSSESEVMKEYFRLHVLTKNKHGSEPFPKLFFESLSQVQKHDVDILMAKHNDTYIAGLLGFVFNNRVHIFDNCSDPNYLKFNPNNLLYYSIIEKARNNKFEVDFGRTTTDDKNLRQFKERWGSKSYTYGTYMKILPPKTMNVIKLGLMSIKKRGLISTLKRGFQRG